MHTPQTHSPLSPGLLAPGWPSCLRPVFFGLACMLLLFCGARAGTSSPITIGPAVIALPTVGSPYSQAFTATGGTAPYTWSAGVALPAGFTLNSLTGVVSGQNFVAANQVFLLRATDSAGLVAQRAYAVKVVLASAGSPPATQPVTTTPPTPTTPPGTTIPATTTPAATAPSVALAIATAALPSAINGASYSQTLVAVGGTPPYAWKVASGSFPPGLVLAQSGLLAGTPKASGTWMFAYPFSAYVLVTDSNGKTSAASYPVPLVASAGAPASAPVPVTPPVTPPVIVTPPVTMTPGPTTGAAAPSATPAAPTNPILFVTQIPIGFDFTTVGSTFGNHRPSTDSAGRGGDLYIRYPDGTLRNLTAEAGYGTASGFQGANSIAVRDPSVYWDGTKAVFSMVVGAPTSAFGGGSGRWQIYEVTGLVAGQTAVITPVPRQPGSYNNVSPCYGTNGRILFVSDQPRVPQSHLYPQLDEYELAPTTTGLWSLDPSTGDIFNLNHTPSGAFSPSVDSFGRVVFVRWDHLQRDQEADKDNDDIASGQAPTFGTFNYSDESAGATVLAGVRTEVFPEPRTPAGNTVGHVFNVFFPWMIAEDGTGEETLNHIGRHELSGYVPGSISGDNSIGTYSFGATLRHNQTTYLNNFLHMREDPLVPGRYLGTDAPEFSTHAGGQLVAITAPVGLDADHISLTYVTDPLGKISGTQSNHPGHFRDPLPLSNGTLVAVHTAFTDVESKRGIGSDYDFRLKSLRLVNGLYQPYQNLTPGFTKSVSFYANGVLVSYSGPLWEMNPVEVRARPIIQTASTPLPSIEQQVFDEEGVSVPAFKNYLKSKNLALIVSRNVTTRDHAERQQPYNLRITGTNTLTTGNGGKLYDVSFLQLFQADQIRGFGLSGPGSTPSAGRRVLAQPLHDPAAVEANPPALSAPAGGVQLGTDGSLAAFLPARRATTWQLTDQGGAPVVRERYWLTFQPGEIRSCTSCHGVNTRDQANHPVPTNKPEALRTLLRYWKEQTGN